jgi:hypothetical protein
VGEGGGNPGIPGLAAAAAAGAVITAAVAAVLWSRAARKSRGADDAMMRRAVREAVAALAGAGYPEDGPGVS